MIYSLKFVYQDNKDLVINISAEKLHGFFSALNSKQMYFDELNNMGFWTDLDKIRYVQAFQVPFQEGGQVDANSETAPVNNELSREKGGDSSVEAIA